MNTVTKTKWMMLAVVTLLAACTSENELDNGGNGQGTTADAARREVLVTFKNKLAVAEAAATKADTPIATTEENTVSSLDVYVFASDDEAGPFTYQERFAYRKKGVALPSGASSLDMQATGKENEYTALLSLQKGLFVKLYCIANQPSLVDPANEGAAVADAYFQPLIQTTPGQTGSKVKTAGIPTEAEFVSFHTPLLSAGVESDTLVCPLPMSGSYTRPLDLTDYAVSSRMQAGFKLTRMVSRFDITNDADQSKFTIESVSLAKGRRGMDFFTMTPFSSTPADPAADLITYPDRAFFGDKANAGTQTGAFYCYPSPTDDDAYLILKGKYRINQTEQKEVSYNVPFKQMKADGTGSYIEITPNHRYTVAITNATEEGVQFTLDVTDWDEGNEVDDYEPENTPDNLTITIPDAYSTVTRLVTPGRMVMSLDAGSNFTLTANTGSTLSVTKTYSSGGANYDWLEISDPVVANTKAGAFGYTYTVSLKAEYTGDAYPRAVLKFKDSASGVTSKLIIDPIGKPTVAKEGISIPNGDKIEEGSTPSITLYKHPDKVSTMQIKVSSYGGNRLDYTGTGMKLPATVSSDAGEALYTLTATGAGTGTLKIINKTDTALTVTYAVNVIESGISLPVVPNLQLTMTPGTTASLSDISSVLGITVNTDWGTDGIAWFDFTTPLNITAGSGKNIDIKTKTNLTSLDAGKIKEATVMLTTEGDTAHFKVTPVWLAPANATTPSAQPTAFTVNAGANTEIRLVSPVPFGVKVISDTPSALSFTSLDNSTGLVTLKGVSKGKSTLTISSQDGSNPIEYTITVAEIPASSYVAIRGSDGKTLKWAVGNLVAQGPSPCTIGAPTDYGLHFRWGSLVGYDANNRTVNPLPTVKPNGYKDAPTFTASKEVTDASLPSTPSSITAKGDPCRYYLGGTWRMPTEAEYRNGIGGGVTGTTKFTTYQWITTTPKGIKVGPNKELFFSASGVRMNNGGNVVNTESEGCIWASTTSSTTAYFMQFSAGNANVFNFERTYGRSIRCVQN